MKRFVGVSPPRVMASHLTKAVSIPWADELRDRSAIENSWCGVGNRTTVMRIIE